MLLLDSDEEKQSAHTETTGREAVSFPVDGLSAVNKRRSRVLSLRFGLPCERRTAHSVSAAAEG